MNTLGISPGSRVMGALAALKLGLLGFLVIWGFGLGRGDWSNLTPFWSQRPGSDPFLPAVGLALVGAFIAFAGWWDVSKIAGEVRDPKRTMPRALVLGVSIVTVVYVAVSVVFLYLVSPEQIAADSGAFAALAGDALFGRRGEVIFSLVVVISVAGSLAAVLMAAPRVYFAMARDGIFFASFGAVDPRARCSRSGHRGAGHACRRTGPDRQLRSDPLVFHGSHFGFPRAHSRWGFRRCTAAIRASDRWHRRVTRSLPCSSWSRSWP